MRVWEEERQRAQHRERIAPAWPPPDVRQAIEREQERQRIAREWPHDLEQALAVSAAAPTRWEQGRYEEEPEPEPEPVEPVWLLEAASLSASACAA